MNFTRLQDQHDMIGKRVTAVGCCGTKDGIEIEGILHKVDQHGAVVLISFGKRVDCMPALVNGGTLRLKMETTHSFNDEQKMNELFNDLTKAL